MHPAARPPTRPGGACAGDPPAGSGGESWSRTGPPEDGPAGFQTRSRRASSGYFSWDGDSLLRHAQRAAEHGQTSSCSSSRHKKETQTQEMQTQEMGRELRRIGDDFNRLLLLRGGPRRPVDPQNPQQDPTLLLCVGLLLLLIGRFVYLQAGTNSQDPAQV